MNEREDHGRAGVHAWEDARARGVVGEVLPAKLLIGDRTVAQMYSALREAGVLRIINATQSCPNFFEKGGGASSEECELTETTSVEEPLEYLRLDVDDDPKAAPVLASHFTQAAEFVSSGPGATLVHCESGMSRSGAVAIAVVMILQGATLKAAYDCVRSARPVLLPNLGFFSELRALDVKLRGHESMTEFDYMLKKLMHPFMSTEEGRARQALEAVSARSRGYDAYHDALDWLEEHPCLVDSTVFFHIPKLVDRPTIFLDVDGPLHSSVFMMGPREEQFVSQRLDRLAEFAADSQIVLSSTWRMLESDPPMEALHAGQVLPTLVEDLQALVTALDRHGMCFVSATPRLPSYEREALDAAGTRAEEITRWLRAHPQVTSPCAAVDDLDMTTELVDRCGDRVHMLLVSSAAGLDGATVAQIQAVRDHLSSPRRWAPKAKSKAAAAGTGRSRGRSSSAHRTSPARNASRK